MAARSLSSVVGADGSLASVVGADGSFSSAGEPLGGVVGGLGFVGAVGCEVGWAAGVDVDEDEDGDADADVVVAPREPDNEDVCAELVGIDCDVDEPSSCG